MALSLFQDAIAAITQIIIAPTTKIGIAMSSLMPSSIEPLAKAHTFAFWAYVFLLLLTALATVWLWLAGNKYQDAVKANADARIEEAKTIAAGANERAGKLENDNLNLRGKVADLEIQVEQQRERAAKAEEQLERLKRQMPPPRIPKEFSEALKGVPPGIVFIKYNKGDAAALVFANELFNVLKSLGWSPRGPEIGDTQLFTRINDMFSPGDAITIMGTPKFGPSEPNPMLYGLRDAFRKGGFGVSMHSNTSLVTQEIIVIINPRLGGPRSLF